MTEEFLHYIWKFRSFNQQNLETTEGEPLEILRPGEGNTDAGPDFFNARIRIGKTMWAGNVEIHICSSDWFKHRHPSDKAYSNIILHVVHEADVPIRNKEGRLIPTLELTGRIEAAQYKKYLDFQSSNTWNACGTQAGEADRITLESWMERLLVERLERKSNRILSSLELNLNNWEESFYLQLARNFGFRINAIPFELLAKSLPLTLLYRYADNLFILEALFFGQAGMLDKQLKEPYAQRLQAEYQFLARKHRLMSMDGSLWKFLRLRPLNFPTVRIAQFAMLFHHTSPFFSRVLDAPHLEGLKGLFSSGVSEFWKSHYSFESESPTSLKHIGVESIENIIINTVAPFLFVYGREKGEFHAGNYALDLLSRVKPENNQVMRSWHAVGLNATDGGRSQALYELRESYCVSKRCLDCAIGRDLLKKEMDVVKN